MQEITEDTDGVASSLPSFSNGKAKRNGEAFPKRAYIGKVGGEMKEPSIGSPKIAISRESKDASPNVSQSLDLSAQSQSLASSHLSPSSALHPLSNAGAGRNSSSSLLNSTQQKQSYNPFAPNPFAPSPEDSSFQSPHSGGRRKSCQSGNLAHSAFSPAADSGFNGGRRGSSAGVRRASMSAPGRRGSIMAGGHVTQMFDEEALKYFWTNRGLTQQDVDVAFKLLSKDGQKLTHADIKLFVSTYFDWFPEEAMTVLNSWKEEVTKTQLEEVLLGKQLMSSPYESAFKWFQPENGFLGKQQLKKIAKNVAPRKLPGKSDVKTILSKYDNDRDNLIGLEDFKKMGLY